MGSSQASSAPADINDVSTPGQSLGSRSSTLACSTSTVSPSSVVAADLLAEHDADHVRHARGVPGTGADPHRGDREGRQVSIFRCQGDDQRHAGRCRPLPRPAVAAPASRAPTAPPRVRASGTSPCATRARPEPTATSPAVTVVTPRSCSAAHTPTTSAIESRAPTSWKCTSCAGMPCTWPSASASREKTAVARSRTGSGMVAASSISLMVRQVRCGGSSTSTRTSTLVARSPARLTVVRVNSTESGITASTTRRTTSRSAPASISAPSSMSPATPAEASIQACSPVPLTRRPASGRRSARPDDRRRNRCRC